VKIRLHYQVKVGTDKRHISTVDFSYAA